MNEDDILLEGMNSYENYLADRERIETASKHVQQQQGQQQIPVQPEYLS